MQKVFVYGSLTTGCRYNQYYLQGKPFMGKAFANGYKKYHLGGGLDGIAVDENDRVPGEVYEVDSLAKLDFLHNEAFFTKNTIEVEMENGDTVEALAYIMV